MSNDLDFFFKPIVLVTGFGPFINHPINASWEAVKLMNKEEIEERHNVELVTLEIPVTYENVDEFIPALWETHTPKLMFHVGVSSIAQCLTIETQAHKKGYQKKDYFDNCPANNTNPVDGAVRIQTQLDVERICKEFNDGNPIGNATAVSSKDAGRYLCEYTFYSSLATDRSRTVFVHVPDLSIYPAEQTARALERVLRLCLDQVNEMEAKEEINDKMKKVDIEGGDYNEV